MSDVLDDRTVCPHCGLKSRTVERGICVECWRDKRVKTLYAPGRRPLRDRPRPREGGGSSEIWLLDEIFDAIFDDWLSPP